MSCSVSVSSTTLSSRSLILSYASSSLLLNPSGVFFRGYYILQFYDFCLEYFLIFSVSAEVFHCVHPSFSQWTFLWPLLWILYQQNYLSFVSWAFFFPRIYLVLLFRTYSFVSSFCLTFCVCFYVIRGKATSSCLEGVALHRRWTILFNLALPLDCLSNLCDI